MTTNPSENKRISVVIPVLNESRIIGQCLALLGAEIGHHQIVLVDGGSLDGTMDIASAFPNVKRLFSSAVRGRQMNRGAEAAEGDAECGCGHPDIWRFFGLSSRPAHPGF